MKFTTKAGCLILTVAALTGAAGCKRSAANNDNRIANANTGIPVEKPAPPKKSNNTFITSEKTPNGEDMYRLTEAGVKFTLPKNWSAVPDESQMALSSEDNALRIMIVVPTNSDYDGVINSLPEELAKIIQNAKPDGVASRTKLNGMEALTQHGVGDLDDATVSWKIDVVKAKRPVIILSYATTEIDEAHNQEYGVFMDSILPLS